MIKRDVTETVYEYDKEGKLVKKTVTETHEEDNNTSITWPYTNPYIYCNTNDTNKVQEVQRSLNDSLISTSTTADWKYKGATTTCNCVQE
jgi:hypothetical protein